MERPVGLQQVHAGMKSGGDEGPWTESVVDGFHDNDGGWHVWNTKPEMAQEEAGQPRPQQIPSEDNCAKRSYWNEMIVVPEGQETVMLAELAMAEYHLRELKQMVQEVTHRVEHKKEQLGNWNKNGSLFGH